ncbi:ribosomal maturation YjgA family protein [Aureivirga marina]|uniref:ribosomal maturation YjgA family protein n=1 Tax=Aureivirga marina TaxID=1182451 RepID=UPI0018CB0C6F|nr:DUF2809 domain-containing protein [Aureivirga marina]
MKIQIRNRIFYFILAVFTIFLGLSSRMSFMPMFVITYFGDALYAVLIYFGIRFILVEKSLKTAFLGSLFFCFFIELFQLYKATWIVEIRQTRIGSLILGQGFLWSDLLLYTIGICFIFFLDRNYLSLKIKSSR